MNALLDTISMLASPRAFLVRASRRALAGGGVTSVLLGRRSFLVATPELTARVLTDRAREFGMAAAYSKLRLLIGNGLTVSDGGTWQRRKRALAEQFGSEALSRYLPAMADATIGIVADLTKKNGPLLAEPYLAMRRYALAAISAVTFGRDIATPPLTRALMRSGDYIGKLMLSPFDRPAWFPSLQAQRFWRDRRFVDNAIMPDVMTAVRGDGPESILKTLAKVVDPDGRHLYDAALLRDEAMTLIMAGHESSGATLAWTLHYLARDSVLQAALRVETRALDAALCNGEQTMLGLAQKCVLARSVIDEVMRLHPAIWVMARSVVKPTALGGVSLLPKDQILVSAQIVHRDPACWEDPHTFLPQRFVEAYQGGAVPLWKVVAPQGVPAENYIPFGAGARLCVGAGFARVLSLVLLARLLGACELAAEASAFPRPVLRVVQYPRHEGRGRGLSLSPRRT